MDKEKVREELKKLSEYDSKKDFKSINELCYLYLMDKIGYLASEEEIEDILYSFQDECGKSHLLSPELCSELAQALVGSVGVKEKEDKSDENG